jgi:hypothetical protein
VEALPTVAAITQPDLSNLQVVGGYLVLAGLFVLREIASGALKEAGKELWNWVKSRWTARRRRIDQCARVEKVRQDVVTG